jgi:hypothetical protein
MVSREKTAPISARAETIKVFMGADKNHGGISSFARKSDARPISLFGCWRAEISRFTVAFYVPSCQSPATKSPYRKPSPPPSPTTAVPPIPVGIGARRARIGTRCGQGRSGHGELGPALARATRDAARRGPRRQRGGVGQCKRRGQLGAVWARCARLSWRQRRRAGAGGGGGQARADGRRGTCGGRWGPGAGA